MGTFEETARSHLEQTRSATPAQRLAWLEEALELAYQAGALPLKPRKDTSETENSEKKKEAGYPKKFITASLSADYQ
jgi:hypothetical protein